MFTAQVALHAGEQEKAHSNDKHSIVLMTIVSKYTTQPHIYNTSRQKNKAVEGHNMTCKASAIVLASGRL